MGTKYGAVESLLIKKASKCACCGGFVVMSEHEINVLLIGRVAPTLFCKECEENNSMEEYYMEKTHA